MIIDPGHTFRFGPPAAGWPDFCADCGARLGLVESATLRLPAPSEAPLTPCAHQGPERETR